MKLIIAGSRDLAVSFCFMEEVLDNFKISRSEVSEIICGCATGIDQNGAELAYEYDIPVKKFPPNWEQYGKSAGPIRNALMAGYGDSLLLIWDGKSRGSANMKRQMEQLNKPIYEVILKGIK